MTAHRQAGLRPVALVGALLLAAPALAGCVQDEPAPSATSPVSTSATSAGTSAASSAAAAPTTSTLPGMPAPTTVGTSPIDPSAITSLASMAAAFGCSTAVTPITIPAVTSSPPLPPPVTSGTATIQPAPTGTATVTPPVLVCASSVAGGEALYLWYAPTPQAKLVALQQALLRTAYVHGGPNWVAGGTVDPRMGQVGGEVYR